jgi:hypothetical protein
MENNLKSKVLKEIAFRENMIRIDYIRSLWKKRSGNLGESTIYLKEARCLYHGTDSNRLSGIQQREALVPSNEHEYGTNFSQSLNSVIYLTTSITRAIYWAKLSVERHKGEPIVIKIPKEAIISQLFRDRNLLWDETSFQVENIEIRNFEVIEEDGFWNEIRKALGFTKGVPSKDYIEIRYAIEHNKGIRPQFSEIPESFKHDIGFAGFK